MNYQKIYNDIINKRKDLPIEEGYGETHHIVPRSLGGSDTADNLVKLTAREHFTCHCLLSKMYKEGTNEWYKMNHAFMMMKAQSLTHQRYFNSHLYQYFRENFSAAMSVAQSGTRNSQHGTTWIHNPVKQLNKKIPKDQPLPDGWLVGRKTNWVEKKKICPMCQSQFDHRPNAVYCSTQCRSSSKTSKLSGREEELIAAYHSTGNLNKALQQLGFPGAVGSYYRCAKKIIDSIPPDRQN